MLYPEASSAAKDPDDISSAKAAKGSALKTAQLLSQRPPAFEDRTVALMMSVVGIAGFMLAVVSPNCLRGHDRGGRALSRHSATRRAAELFQVSETGSEAEDG
jgi:type IV secretory pathway protease TraF